MSTHEQLITWLLDQRNPSLRYRTLTELLDKSQDDPDVEGARAMIPGSEAACEILHKMHPDGYWLQKKQYKDRVLGDGVEYGSFATTHYCLSYLAELGLDRSHPQVAKAAERYLNLQQPDGDFWNHMSCLFAYNIRTFIMLGYRDDERIQKTIDLMLATTRLDGGYLCDMHERKKKNGVKSCIRGSAKALQAFSLLPEYWAHERCQALLAYFLERDGLFRRGDHTQPANRDTTRTLFPFTWKAGLLDILGALSRMGYGKHPELKKAWDVLAGKKDVNGRYVLDWTPSQSLLKVGKAEEANPWIAFYSLLALKYRG